MIHLQSDELFGGSSALSPSNLDFQDRSIRQINLLMSDTGGGHRACATALQQAFLKEDPSLGVNIIDGLTEPGTFPLPYLPRLYTRWSGKRNLWRTTFHLTNGRRWANIVFYPIRKRTQPALTRTIMRNSPDLVVVLHPCLTNVTYKGLAKLGPNRPQVATVITDLVYGHASWFSHGADEYFVPTEAMRDRAIRNQIAPDKIHVTGLPLAHRLFDLRQRKTQLRAELGFDRPSVVCVGGADGMGIQRVFPALKRLSRGIDVHVICGKNESLRNRLLSKKLRPNIKIHGFTNNLPEMLAAADVALIKASPTVLMEAIAVGTYVLLYDFVPGQEYPNVGWVQEHGLGDYSRSPRTIKTKIQRYVAKMAQLPETERATSYVPPDGAQIIARHLLGVRNTSQSAQQA